MPESTTPSSLTTRSGFSSFVVGHRDGSGSPLKHGGDDGPLVADKTQNVYARPRPRGPRTRWSGRCALAVVRSELKTQLSPPVDRSMLARQEVRRGVSGLTRKSMFPRSSSVRSQPGVRGAVFAGRELPMAPGICSEACSDSHVRFGFRAPSHDATISAPTRRCPDITFAVVRFRDHGSQACPRCSRTSRGCVCCTWPSMSDGLASTGGRLAFMVQGAERLSRGRRFTAFKGWERIATVHCVRRIGHESCAKTRQCSIPHSARLLPARSTRKLPAHAGAASP